MALAAGRLGARRGAPGGPWGAAAAPNRGPWRWPPASLGRGAPLRGSPPRGGPGAARGGARSGGRGLGDPAAAAGSGALVRAAARAAAASCAAGAAAAGWRRPFRAVCAGGCALALPSDLTARTGSRGLPATPPSPPPLAGACLAPRAADWRPPLERVRSWSSCARPEAPREATSRGAAAARAAAAWRNQGFANARGSTDLFSRAAGAGPAGRARAAAGAADAALVRSPGTGLLHQPVNEAGFPVSIRMSPEEADQLGLKPFGDGGAADGTRPRPKLYTHGPCTSTAAAHHVVPCGAWRAAPPAGRRATARRALEGLRENGFVVLESLFLPAEIRPIESEAAWFLNSPQDGFIPQPLRAGRTEGHVPFSVPWASDWLMKNEIVLEVVAGYMHNNLAAGRTHEEQQWGLVQWLTSGAELDWFRSPEWGPKPGRLLEHPPPGCSDVGSAGETGPFFGRVSLIKTPSGSEPQKYHRDINFPGPTAQLTVQVALTPLAANNGPLGYVPQSHRMQTPGYEVIANPPLGSVVLYDSFCEHRGIENHSPRDRYALYYEFETRGVFSGYTAEHFGPRSMAHTAAFRLAVDPELRRWAAAAQRAAPRAG